MTIQTLSQNEIVAEIPEHTASKKSIIKVLHVDDDPSVQEITKLMLQDIDSGFKIDFASCVDDAFKKLAVSHYDVVVSDYEMPKKDGLQFLKELSEQKKDIPFILFTGKGREEIAIKALNLGADGYFNKQGSPETVYGELAYGIRLAAQRAKAQFDLEENEKRLKAILSNAPVGIATSGLSTLFLSANEAFCRILGYSEDDLRKLTFREITHPDDVKESSSLVAELISGRIPCFSQKKRYIRKDGRIIYGKVTVSAVLGKEDRPTIFIAQLEDITDQKHEKEALKESEAKLRSIAENSSDQIFMLDKNCIYLVANKAMADVLGKTPKEIIGKSISELYPAQTAEQIINNAKKVFETGKHMFLEESMVAIDQKLYISTILNPVQDDAGNVIAVTGVVRDISERKMSQDKSDEIGGIVDGIGDLLFVMDRNRVITKVNKTTCDVFNKRPEEIVGKHCYEIVHGTDKPWVNCPATEMFKTKTTASAEVIDPHLGAPLLVTTSPISDKTGELTHCVHLAKDISKLKLAEQKLKEKNARIELMVEKLRVVGGLTRHDVRNKLSAVTAYAYLLKKKHGDQTDIVEGLSKMEQSVKESMKIFEFAKMYEQLGAEELSYINVEAKLTEATTLFTGQLPKIINQCHGLTVLADSFLQQLFYNLIDNTKKHGQKSTTIKVHYEKTTQDTLKLIYEDNGVGIPLENKPNLFKEGFSTGGSTGFGLFLTRKMMDIYGWKIEEKGEPNIGAKFTITIPRINEKGKENYQITQ